ncbi:hypothetical protein BDD12DRAFT_878854 [Trichophaea hybrida]|nr:hypothetical protein BDD12DRAFT_878854 [Trichophaea hybrida]
MRQTHLKIEHNGAPQRSLKQPQMTLLHIKSPRAPLEASELATEYTIAIQEPPRAPVEASEVATEYTIVIQESAITLFEASEVTTEYTLAIQDSPRKSPRATLEVSEMATEYIIAIQISCRALSEASEVATEYPIAIQESPRAPLGVSEVATEYTIAIQENPGAASSHLGEQGRALRLQSPVQEDSQRVCSVHYLKSTSATSGRSQGFRNQTIDFADEVLSYTVFQNSGACMLQQLLANYSPAGTTES